MKIINKIVTFLLLLGFVFPHGISDADKSQMTQGSLMDYMYLGAKHMITGYDHILFLVGVIFFLTKFSDIVKFVTAFTIGHSITLIFATLYNITANYYLIDAVIAFSVIYKGFENLGGFKKILSINAPSLISMVFIFGLIHGFGLSTKLQEIAAEHNINLSLSQILSFNVGVEFGQILVLLLIYPLLTMLRGKFFETISKFSNWGLIVAGTFLLVFQLNGFFEGDNHEHHEPTEHNHNHTH